MLYLKICKKIFKQHHNIRTGNKHLIHSNSCMYQIKLPKTESFRTIFLHESVRRVSARAQKIVRAQQWGWVRASARITGAKPSAAPSTAVRSCWDFKTRTCYSVWFVIECREEACLNFAPYPATIWRIFSNENHLKVLWI